MKKLKVITASPGLSGAGLIFDYLLSRKDFVSPFKKIPDDDQQTEFKFISDPGGLNSLYKGFYENFSVNNASYVFYEFKNYLNNLKKLTIIKNDKKIKLYNKYFFNEANKFIKKIVITQYYGLPQYFRIGLNKKDRALWKIVNKFKSAQEFKVLDMVLPVEKKIFIKEATNFVDLILKKLAREKDRNLVIDQGANFFRPIESTKFFSNKKIILVTRDPRSIFSSMKKRQSLAYPGHNISVFIEWYKNLMKFSQKHKNSKEIIYIKYENFLTNHQFEAKRLLKFLNLKPTKQINFNLQNSKINIFKAKKNLTKKELKLIEKKLKKYLQWPKKNYI